MASRVGQQLGNYRLVRLLGQGGFADVYQGEHIHLGTEAAIKVLAIRLLGEEFERFRSEARTIAHLEHPHIVRVFDFDIEDHTPFLVMEYAPKGSLRQQHAKGTRLALEAIVSYVKQIAEALLYAHNQKLIHRDIKPDNMLLRRNDDVLLSDFGIAVLAHSTSSLDMQLGRVGTLPYIAPEQLQGKPRVASDQYALGIVVYEWLSGTRPFSGTAWEIVSQHMSTPPPPLRENVPTISPDVEQVVLKALAKDPHQRFVSVQEFANKLEQACQGVSFRPVVLSTQTASSSQSSSPTDATTGISPDQSSLPRDVVAPPDQPAVLTDIATQHRPAAATSLSSMREPVPFDEPQPTKRTLPLLDGVAAREQTPHAMPMGQGNILTSSRPSAHQISLPQPKIPHVLPYAISRKALPLGRGFVAVVISIFMIAGIISSSPLPLTPSLSISGHFGGGAFHYTVYGKGFTPGGRVCLSGSSALDHDLPLPLPSEHCAAESNRITSPRASRAGTFALDVTIVFSESLHPHMIIITICATDNTTLLRGCVESLYDHL